ncbi:hypothetical protein [Candidiatus Paracoxiella cheracis]|uniref:hypothetical protein n=1 Tax=Candidiatus Paracoxiella cheracis TaxID=3405120 RepID=UPI003BF59225
MQINNKKDVIACHSAADDLEDVYYEPDVIDQQASMSERDCLLVCVNRVSQNYESAIVLTDFLILSKTTLRSN